MTSEILFQFFSDQQTEIIIVWRSYYLYIIRETMSIESNWHRSNRYIHRVPKIRVDNIGRFQNSLIMFQC